MSPRGLLRWQWEGYPRYHQHRTNLLLHIVAGPMFLLSSLALMGGALARSPGWLAGGLAGAAVAVVVQSRGHRLEPVPAEPFTGPLNFAGRLLSEQWVTFPRFVLSGGWRAGLQRSAPGPRASRERA